MSDKFFNDLTAPFTGNQLQVFLTIADRVRDWGLSVDEFYRVAQVQLAEQKNSVALPPGKPEKSNARNGVCPDCGGELKTATVNTTQCNQVAGNYSHMRFCRCGYTSFFKVVKK